MDIASIRSLTVCSGQLIFIFETRRVGNLMKLDGIRHVDNQKIFHFIKSLTFKTGGAFTQTRFQTILPHVKQIITVPAVD